MVKIEEMEDFHKKVAKDFKENYHGGISWEEYLSIRSACGCAKCDCDALSQDSYRKGCHTFGLFDQENDSTNTLESGGYDESIGFIKEDNRGISPEEADFFSISVEKK